MRYESYPPQTPAFLGLVITETELGGWRTNLHYAELDYNPSISH